MMTNDNNHPFVTVRFSAVEEFLEELKKTGDYIEPILRITKLFTQSQHLPLRYVSVEAAVLRDTPPIVQRVRFECQCGEMLAHSSHNESNATMERAEKIQKTIEAAAVELGLEVRAGLYE